jgi:hypothetical protein
MKGKYDHCNKPKCIQASNYDERMKQCAEKKICSLRDHPKKEDIDGSWFSCTRTTQDYLETPSFVRERTVIMRRRKQTAGEPVCDLNRLG